MRGGDLYKPKEESGMKPHKSIRKESPRRQVERVYYMEQIKMFWDESVEKGFDFCFFCGKKMAKRDNVHHLRGRTGDYYLDKDWWVNAHNKCHLDYHRMTVEQLKKESWYDAFMERLRVKDPETYQKEINKTQKKILFDEDMIYF